MAQKAYLHALIYAWVIKCIVNDKEYDERERDRERGFENNRSHGQIVVVLVDGNSAHALLPNYSLWMVMLTGSVLSNAFRWPQKHYCVCCFWHTSTFKNNLYRRMEIFFFIKHAGISWDIHVHVLMKALRTNTLLVFS